MRLFIILFIFSTVVCSGLAYNREDDERYEAQKNHNDLLDREKTLAKQHDDLGQAIFTTKQKIKYLQNDLDALNTELVRVRHELILTRVKLLN